MLLKCIKRGPYVLTVGKNYQAADDYFSDSSSSIKYYYITNDNGVSHAAEANLFTDINELRTKKFKELGI